MSRQGTACTRWSPKASPNTGILGHSEGGGKSPWGSSVHTLENECIKPPPRERAFPESGEKGKERQKEGCWEMEGSQVSQTRAEPVTFPVYTTGGRAHGRSARPAGRPNPRGTPGHVVTGGVTSRWAPLANGGSKVSKEGGSYCGTGPGPGGAARRGSALGVRPAPNSQGLAKREHSIFRDLCGEPTPYRHHKRAELQGTSARAVPLLP